MNGKRRIWGWVLAGICAAVVVAALGLVMRQTREVFDFGFAESARLVDGTLVAKAAVLSGTPQNPVCIERENDFWTCSGDACDVKLDIPTRQGGVADLYYCHPDYFVCYPQGNCSDTEACVVGHGRTLTVNQKRTDALPPHGPVPSCPYHDEEYGQ